MPIRQSIGNMAKPKKRATWELRPSMSPGQSCAYMSTVPGQPVHYHTEPNEAKARADAYNNANKN